ncbi:MAG TPA: COX15/CtaA family protein [Acidimicrobiales bacterium]|nr:COX15/CtaA family protein [Acidimicrobiales bacterium]
MSSLRIGPRPFLLLCRFTLAVTVLNIVTGAAVRLSDSGLGCPDWPTCSQHHLTPALRLHPLVEFGNRVVVAVLVVACIATAIASLLRRPARSDLRWFSTGLVLGVIGEAVLGAFVVYSKLNPYVVMTHFMVGMALLAVAVVLVLKAGCRPGPGTPVVSAAARWLTRVLIAMTVVVLAAGAATTGTGPHAGGKGAKRIPLGLEDMTRIHAEIVLATGAVLLTLLWVLWRSDAPARIQDSGRILLAVIVVQGIVGYTQFFTHLPAVLVGIHVFGASMVWATALWFSFGTSDHLPESVGLGPDVGAEPESEARALGRLAVTADRGATREPV